MLAVTSVAPWDSIYVIVGTVVMVIGLVSMAVRPVAGRTRRATDAAAKLAFDSAEAAAKLTVEASGASNKLAADTAAAAAALNLESAVRNERIDSRLNTLVSLQEGTTKRLESLVRVQEGHERRLTILEVTRENAAE